MNKRFTLVLLFSFFMLTACGGGGSDAPDEVGTAPSGEPGVTTVSLSGTAAAGAPVIGQVTVKGSLGNSKSALIEADGSYNVDVSGLTAPYRLRAEGTVGGRLIKLHSYAEAADVDGTVNITPFTDLIVANAAQMIASSFFDSTTTAAIDATTLAEQEAALQTKLQAVFDVLGVGTAVDLLHTSFSADHSGLDAALDAISVDIDSSTNVATITNVIEGSSISDSILDPSDNSPALTISDSTTFNEAVTDTQAIAAIFDSLTQAFASALPNQASIQDYFSTDFYDYDEPRSLFLTDITTDPSLVGLTFSGVSISNLDSTLGTATVAFYTGQNGYVEPEVNTWLVSRDPSQGWQLRGDQRIADMYFNFHCNDNDGNGSFTGACGINTMVTDNDFTNNGTAADAPIASAKVSILDGSNTANIRKVIYLGTPVTSSAGDVQVYDEGSQTYQEDWKAFGGSIEEVDPTVIQAGDIIEYQLFTADLDTTTPTMPQVTGTAVATYTDTLLYAPANTGLYPTITPSALTAMSNFVPGDNLTISWTLDSGTVSHEILVRLSDGNGNNLEIWDSSFAHDATSTTIASTLLDTTALGNEGLDSTANSYTLLVRIYAMDAVTGQQHSTDYTVTTGGSGDPTGSTFSCGYESGWDDTAYGGTGGPITPNSFADYEAVIAACGTAQTFTAAEVSGKVLKEVGSIESMSFNAGTGSAATPASGIYDDGEGFTFNFEWWVEAATCTGCNYSYLVIYSDTSIASNLPISWLRETAVLTGISGTANVAGAQYSYTKYSEQSTFSDSDRATGSDGEIWHSVDALQ